MLRKNLAVQIVAGFVCVIAVLAVLVCIIGYQRFTLSASTQYEDCAYNTARTAATMIVPELLTGEIAGAEYQMRFKMLNDEWERLANTQDATFIYLIRPDKTDYDHIEFFLSVMNKSAHYERYPSGYLRKTSNDEYRNAYREICENGKSMATIFRDKGDSETGHHITVMIPVKARNSDRVDWILCVQRQMERLNFYRKSYVQHVAIAAAVILGFVLTVYGVYLGRLLIVPLKKIASEAMRFAGEHTEPESPLGKHITAKNEIGQLARTVDAMESQVLSYIDGITRITQEKEQIKAELNIAAGIQASMLPREFPVRKEFEIFASMTPAKEVGGDFYDFFMADDSHLAMVIADVSGKGVPASLFMAISKALIKNRALMGGSPAEILADVNNQLCEGNEAGLFVTVWLGIVDIKTGNVKASNAGHEYPAIFRKGEGWSLMKDKHSPAVATMEGMKFREYEFDLKSGDCIYLYTDGVAEATNIDSELYGTARMIDALNDTAPKTTPLAISWPSPPSQGACNSLLLPPLTRGGGSRSETEGFSFTAEGVLSAMKRNVDDFTGDAPQFDDITMMMLKFHGEGE
ncbi:MAG: SpoIIE family protein phosphatase [Synergistaceae bacterium]|nr:SpoIIE family protein phosphatase [Synergistaceae bacterium]